MAVLNLKAAEVEKIARWAREHDERHLAEKAEALVAPTEVEEIAGQIDIYDVLGDAA